MYFFIGGIDTIVYVNLDSSGYFLPSTFTSALSLTLLQSYSLSVASQGAGWADCAVVSCPGRRLPPLGPQSPSHSDSRGSPDTTDWSSQSSETCSP